MNAQQLLKKRAEYLASQEYAIHLKKAEEYFNNPENLYKENVQDIFYTALFTSHESQEKFTQSLKKDGFFVESNNNKCTVYLQSTDNVAPVEVEATVTVKDAPSKTEDNSKDKSSELDWEKVLQNDSPF